VLELVLNVLEAVLQSFPFGVIGLNSHRVGNFFRMPREVRNVGQGRGCFVPDSTAGLKFGVLLQVAQRRGRMQFDAAAIGFELPRDDFHQRRLARAVRPDQRDPLAGANVERHTVEHRLRAVIFDDVLEREEDHGLILATGPCFSRVSK